MSDHDASDRHPVGEVKPDDRVGTAEKRFDAPEEDAFGDPSGLLRDRVEVDAQVELMDRYPEDLPEAEAQPRLARAHSADDMDAADPIPLPLRHRANCDLVRKAACVGGPSARLKEAPPILSGPGRRRLPCISLRCTNWFAAHWAGHQEHAGRESTTWRGTLALSIRARSSR